MFSKKRRVEIANYLREKKSATVSELAVKFDVSEVTIRKDLNILEEEHLIDRPFGGAIWIGNSINAEINSDIKLTTHIDQKNKIGKQVVAEVNNGNTLFLDAGSTTNILVEYLTDFKELTIVTTDLMIALKLLQQTDFKVIMNGGEISRTTKSVKDYTAVKMLERYNVDIAFIGCDSFSENDGVCTTSSEKAAIKSTAMSIANQSLLLSTSDKFYKRGFFKFAELEDFDKLYVSKPFNDRAEFNGLELEVVEC